MPVSSSEVEAAKKRAEAAKAKAKKMAKEAKMAKAEAAAAERAAEEAKTSDTRITEEKAALDFAEKEMARRLAAKEEAARTKANVAKAAWENTRGVFRDFGAVESVMRSAVYRAMSAAVSAKAGQDGNMAELPSVEDSLGNVERAIELLGGEIDPLAERVAAERHWEESTKPNPWKDLTRNERVAWKVVKDKMERYMKARDALDFAISEAYKTAFEAAGAEMERLSESAKIDMLWYGLGYEEDREIKRLIRRCLASTVMPSADEIVRQIRSSIRVMQGLDAFFEIDSVMTMLQYERGQTDDVALYMGSGENGFTRRQMSVNQIRHFHNTLRRLKEISDGLEMIRGGRVNVKET